mmetsp:Transcript_809/g.1456  ORF Transcript_809/g.1456 Transcript_809/m.1456 type:complete len:206 (-) Transcript_809:489-1106(-)
MEAQSKASNVNEGSLKAQGLVSALYDRVFGDLEIVNSVNHTALLRGYVLPKLDGKILSAVWQLRRLMIFCKDSETIVTCFSPLVGATLKRFLVARKFDVEEGFKMLMNYVQWRLSNPENAVRQEDIKASLDAKKIYVGKHTDKAGRIYFVVSEQVQSKCSQANELNPMILLPIIVQNTINQSLVRCPETQKSQYARNKAANNLLT